jgi:WD40 repeat protein
MMRTAVVAFGILGLPAATLAASHRAPPPIKSAVAVVANVGDLESVSRAVFTRDGRIVATLTGDAARNVRLWDVASGRPLRTLDDDAYFMAVVFSPDGRWIATAHKDGKLALWDVATGATIATLANGGGDDEAAIMSLWVDPKGERIVSGSARGAIAVWDVARRRQVGAIKFGEIRDKDRLPRVHAVRLTADASRIIAVTEETVRVFDARSGRQTSTYDLPNTGPAIPGRERYSFFAGSIVSDDGLMVRLSSDCKADGLAFLRLAAPKDLVEIDKPARCVQGSDDDEAAYPFGEPLIVAAADRPDVLVARFGMPRIEQWDAQARKVVRTVEWPEGAEARLVGVSPDLALAATRDGDRVSVRRVESGATVGELASVSYPAENVVAAGGVFLVSHDRPHATPAQKDMWLWRVDALAPRIVSLAADSDTVIHDFAPDPMLAVAATRKGEVVVFSLATGAEQRRLAVPGITDISRVRISPDGKSIAVIGEDADEKAVALLIGADDGAVKIRFQGRDERNGVVASAGSDDENDLVTSVAFSPDSAGIAIGRFNGTAEVWSIDKAQRLARLAADRNGGDQTWSLAFSDDGRMLIGGSRDAGVFLWDAAAGRLVRTFERDQIRAGHVHFASVAMSRDHRLVAAGNSMHAVSSGDTGVEHRIDVWNAATGRLAFALRGHDGGVGALGFSADDRMIVSASFDGTIRWWDRATGKWLASGVATPDGRWLIVTASGFFAGAAGSDDLVMVARGLEARPGAQFHDQLFRPDLVEQLLRGDREGRYRAAAQKLDLEKVWAARPSP